MELQEALEYVKSNRDREKLKYKGFLYIKDKNYNEKCYWRCENFKTYCCKARIIIANNKIVKSNIKHNHEAAPIKVKKQEVMEEIKAKAKSTHGSTSKILSESLSNVPDNIMPVLPTVNSMKRSIRRARGEEIADMNVPLCDYVVPEKYQTLNDGERFLLYDSGGDTDRIMIFSTKKNLRILSKCKTWLGDGTFDLCPDDMYQIYTLHGLYNGYCVPLVYALLPSKTKETYDRFFDALKGLKRNLKPEIIILDFELAVVNSCTEHFENINIQYCYYHWKQCLYRKICNLGMKSLYDETYEFNLKMKMIFALAFVPSYDVVRVYEAIIEEEFFENMSSGLRKFFRYFEKNYVGRLVGNKRCEPRFLINQWNKYLPTIRKTLRTNNNVEGWHRGFEYMFTQRHVTINKVIQAFQSDYYITKKIIIDASTGVDPEPPRKKYSSYNDRLYNIVSRYNQGVYENECLTYVKDIAILL